MNRALRVALLLVSFTPLGTRSTLAQESAASQGPTAIATSRLALELAASPASSALGVTGAEAPIASSISGGLLAIGDESRNSRRSMTRRRTPGVVNGLGVERARILLQSLTVPGWGQATLGRRTSGTVFALVETGVWTSFTAFRVQVQLRRLSYERTARLFAGIDLHGRDEEFRRIVGVYPSSDDYNRFVVRRAAAELYYGDTENYNEFIAAHELHGADAWAWDSEEDFDRYRNQRKATQRAGLRANAALAMAVANRLVSAIHAARYAGRTAPTPRSWNLECVPVGTDPTAFHLGVRTRF